MKKIILVVIIFQLLVVLLMPLAQAATYNQVILIANSNNNNGISLFPASYQKELEKLIYKTGHTNWKFKPFYTDISWNEFFENEKPCLKNTIYKNNPSSYFCPYMHQGDAGYYCASNSILKYYMDPRNFLTETTIFQFLDLSNSSDVSESTIRNMIKGTYLDTSYNGEHYSKLILEAANQSGESAISITIRIFQELGKGTDTPTMISGTNEKYPGVYNFFNYGASDGADNIEKGLKYAKDRGWVNPKIALIEGAKLVSGSYLKQGQITKYLYKFDVVGDEKNKLFGNQYMTNIADPTNQAKLLFDTYNSYDLIEEELTFVIPIFKEMPAFNKKPNNENINSNLYYVSSNYYDVAWRTGPSTSASIIGRLDKDTLVTMIQENVNGFGKISVNGQEGYMTMEYLSPVNREEDVYEVPTNQIYFLGEEKDNNADLTYQVHLSKIGWTKWEKDGNMIGAREKNTNLESIVVCANSSFQDIDLQYRVHVGDIGWMDWVGQGEKAGTEGKAKYIQAIEFKSNKYKGYNIKARALIEGKQWTQWKDIGEIVGTVGENRPLTAIELKLEVDTSFQKGNIYVGSEKINYEQDISYSTYLKDIGYTGWFGDGQTAGSEGQCRKMTGIKISLGDPTMGKLTYRIHMEDVGWTDYGTTEQGKIDEQKKIEAIQINLESTYYTLTYRTQVQDIGWMPWVENNCVSGTEGQNKRVEAIEIKIVPKETQGLIYKSHSQDTGWQDFVLEGELSGTTGKNKKLEALKIRYPNISYTTLVEGEGWQQWSQSDQLSGTVGKNKKIFAIKVKLENDQDISYRVHVQDYGWLPWKSNGEVAGIENGNKKIEAIEIKLGKDESDSIQYKTHFSNIGWLDKVNLEQIAGDVTKNERLEAIQIISNKSEYKLKYSVHVQDIGWMDEVNDGEIAGTTGRNKKIEAIKIEFSNDVAKKISYRVYVDKQGWQQWKSDGEIAGTTGQNLAIKAIEIKVE